MRPNRKNEFAFSKATWYPCALRFNYYFLIIITIIDGQTSSRPLLVFPVMEVTKTSVLPGTVGIGTGPNFRAQFPWLRGILMAAMMPVPGLYSVFCSSLSLKSIAYYILLLIF